MGSKPAVPLLGLCLGLAALAGAAAAGESETGEPLVTDRPDFTESASTVERGRFQIESGATWTDSDEADGLDVGELLVRIGLARELELRLGVGSYSDADGPPGEAPAGLGDTSLGVKLGLGAGSDWSTALIVRTTLPTGDHELREPHLQPGAVLAVARDLSATTSLGTNLGYTWASAGGEQYSELSGSVALGRSLGERLGGFVELFGFLPADRGGDDTAYFDAGLTWLLSNDLQLDVRAGIGLVSAAEDHFIGAGLSWRR